MWIYWLLMAIPVLGAFWKWPIKASQRWLPWTVVILIYSVLMGFRHEVGGDWFNYFPHFWASGSKSLGEILAEGDPGYYGLNWLVSRLGGHIYEVNIVCATVLMVGLIRFCLAQPYASLALLAAVPYLLVVVGMGYTRQSVALGFALLGLTSLGERNVRQFVAWICIGALFHKSAVLLLPIAALASTRNRFITWGLVGVVSLLMYYLLLEDSSEALWNNYVEAQYESEGGLIRVMMNVVPAMILLLVGKRIIRDKAKYKLWLWISIIAFMCLPLVFMASTAVDRVALYIIPLQIVVYSHLPLIAKSSGIRDLLKGGVVLYCVLVQFVWLNYATHSEYWLPYQFRPI